MADCMEGSPLWPAVRWFVDGGKMPLEYAPPRPAPRSPRYTGMAK